MAYEFKFSRQKAARAKCPGKFHRAYPDAQFVTVSPDNYAAFVNAEI